MSLLAALVSAAAQQASGPTDPWAYYRTVTIDNTAGAAHSDFPVKVSLTSSNFTFAHALSTGYDVQFRAADGVTVLSSWRESFDSSGQTADFWVKVPTVPGSSTTTVRLYYGNPSATDASDIEAVFLLGIDWRIYATSLAAMTGNLSSSTPYLGNRSIATTVPIITHGGTGYRQNSVREQSNIVWDAARSELVFLFTGVNASSVSNVGLCTASSIDGTWTEYGQVLTQAEDPYIVVTTDGELYTDGSGWHYVYFERKPNQADIGVARTKDWRTDWEVWSGSAWTTTVANHAIVLARGAASSWEESFTGSPTVVHDGSQFICLYEGENASLVDATGLARSSDGLTWTKEATNPITALDVIDDMVKIGSTWWLTFHASNGDQYRAKATTEPGTWTSSSLTTDPATRYIRNGNSVNLAFGFTGASAWATFQDGIGTEGMYLQTWIGGDWYGGVTSATTANPRISPLGIASTHDKLVMTPDTSLTHSIYLESATKPLTNNFQVRARRRQLAQTDDQLAGIAIGSGAVAFQSNGNNQHACYADGYLFQLTNPTQFIQIRKYTAGANVDTVATSSVTAAEANNWNLHECSYLSTGALDYKLAGTSRVSRTDTTHLSASKGVALVQGNNSSGTTGAKSEWEWIAVRPYDGADPTVSVGSESSS